MKSSRRKFIKQAAVIIPAASILQSCQPKMTEKIIKPIVVSTWDSGLEVNKVAWMRNKTVEV